MFLTTCIIPGIETIPGGGGGEGHDGSGPAMGLWEQPAGHIYKSLSVTYAQNVKKLQGLRAKDPGWRTRACELLSCCVLG